MRQRIDDWAGRTIRANSRNGANWGGPPRHARPSFCNSRKSFKPPAFDYRLRAGYISETGSSQILNNEADKNGLRQAIRVPKRSALLKREFFHMTPDTCVSVTDRRGKEFDEAVASALARTRIIGWQRERSWRGVSAGGGTISSVKRIGCLLSAAQAPCFP